MINFDFECENQHQFEGCFKDYESFKKQQEMGLIECPLCNTMNVKRIYKGCSIHTKKSKEGQGKTPNFWQYLEAFNNYVKNNFEYVGNSFPDKARAIYYGLEEKKNIYGDVTPSEAKELVEEGIGVFPIIDAEKLIN
ncbi:MAG TPA: DUF1178 family protein [Spirochaetota bacterium]|nr:DUF1178 family protein [Spirochaetota bacterium]